jgi:hypothetical protein
MIQIREKIEALKKRKDAIQSDLIMEKCWEILLAHSLLRIGLGSEDYKEILQDLSIELEKMQEEISHYDQR